MNASGPIGITSEQCSQWATAFGELLRDGFTGTATSPFSGESEPYLPGYCTIYGLGGDEQWTIQVGPTDSDSFGEPYHYGSPSFGTMTSIDNAAPMTVTGGTDSWYGTGVNGSYAGMVARDTVVYITTRSPTSVLTEHGAQQMLAIIAGTA